MHVVQPLCILYLNSFIILESWGISIRFVDVNIALCNASRRHHKAYYAGIKEQLDVGARCYLHAWVRCVWYFICNQYYF